MATSLISIVKVAGKSANQVLDRFRSWETAKTKEDPFSFETQWPEDVRESADQWARQIRQHAHEPPIVWFTEHVDHWSAFPPGHCLNELDDAYLIHGDHFTLMAFSLPLVAETESGLFDDAKNGQYPEIKFFAQLLLQATAAWAPVVGREGVVVILRQTYGGSLDDSVILESLNGVPDYL